MRHDREDPARPGDSGRGPPASGAEESEPPAMDAEGAATSAGEAEEADPSVGEAQEADPSPGEAQEGDAGDGPLDPAADRRMAPWRHGRRAWVWRAPLIGLALTVLLVLPWRWIAPPTTAFLLLYGGSEGRATWEWVPLEAISPEVQIAVVASEDQRFPAHRGLDLEAIRQALSEDEERPRGASTISQQVAKNLYLWSGRSWMRKGLEAWLTLAIEALWPKRRILEVYLNVAQFGPSTFGVGAASRAFFGTEAARLDRRQASLLAVVLPSPRRMSPARPTPYMLQRAAWIRDQVRALGGPAYLSSIR